MNKRYVVELTEEERTQLNQLLAGKYVARRRRLRAQILLKADASPEGPRWTDDRIAEAFDVHRRTVENVRKRCVNEGMEAALNRKRQCRPSRQRILDGEKEAKLVAICCGKVPAGRTRWTLTMLADELVRQEIVESISRETVRGVLKKTR
jgi:transposase